MDTHIRLAHGNGGRLTRQLVESLFQRHLHHEALDIQVDAASVAALPGTVLAITADSFTVDPLEFPGGDIGSLAVHGTLNDLAVAGAEPAYLTLNAIIEEGFEVARLDRIMASLGRTARRWQVPVVAGDTKVVGQGQCGGLYLTMTGIGHYPPSTRLGLDILQPGDQLLISGPVGDHGVAVMLAREQFGLSGDLQSDSACVLPLTRALRDLPGLKFMRDPTRGGLATVVHEIAQATGLDAELDEAHLPVRDSVTTLCDLLGYDALYMACEGRVLAVVAADQADEALCRWRALPEGHGAACIGQLRSGAARVVLNTRLGGKRLLDELEDDPLPRIC